MLKIILISTFILQFSYAQENEQKPFFGEVNGHDISSFEPCVYRKKRGGWYDHCFFNMEGTNDFGDKVSKEAKECATKANLDLYGWLKEKGGDVERAYSVLERVHGRKSIYIIVTDTVGTTIPGASRDRSSLWTWSGTGDGSNGKGHFFKFNIGISEDGTCHIPTKYDMISTIKNWIGEEKFDTEMENLIAGGSTTEEAAIDSSRRGSDSTESSNQSQQSSTSSSSIHE